ncbi:MAG: YlzJ-like family protein [Chloroflexota bacterium]
MTLHTIMPLELVFAQPADAEPPVEVEADGRRLLVQHTGQAWTVVRLLSSDPADYLDPRFQPGTPLATPIRN